MVVDAGVLVVYLFCGREMVDVVDDEGGLDEGDTRVSDVSGKVEDCIGIVSRSCCAAVDFKIYGEFVVGRKVGWEVVNIWNEC